MKNNNELLIKETLEIILKSSSFRISKRNRLLLSFLVNETLTGNANKIKEYTIGVTVFEDLNFELGKSSLVRNQMVRLRKALNDYYAKEGQQDRIKINLEKGQYIPRFIANEQTMQTEEAVTKFFPLLAVLPFKSKWEQDRNEELNEFLVDELTASLSAFSDLHVIANYSILMFFEQGGKMLDLPDSFGLNYLLEGKTVLKQDSLSISLKLINTDSGICTWSQWFNQAIVDDAISTAANQITGTICQTLAGHLGVLTQIHQQKITEKLKNNNGTHLYKALLLARKALLFPETYATVKTFSYLEDAVKIFPESGELHAHYANLLGNAHVLNQQLQEDSWEKATYHMAQAMKLAPSSQYVWTSQALFYKVHEQYDKMRFAAQRAISINPNNAYLVAVNGWTLGIGGFIDEGIDQIEHSLRYLPLKHYYFQFLYFLRAYTNAEYNLALKEAFEFKSDIFWKPLMEMLANEHLNNQKEAETKYLETLALNPDFKENYKFYLSIFVTDKSTFKRMVRCINQVQTRMV
jgi:adenylate cyclase